MSIVLAIVIIILIVVISVLFDEVQAWKNKALDYSYWMYYRHKEAHKYFNKMHEYKQKYENLKRRKK